MSQRSFFAGSSLRRCRAISVLFAALVCFFVGEPARSQPLPAQFVRDRIYVLPETIDGQRLVFYTDTGGGTFLLGGAAARLGLAVETSKDGDAESRIAKLPVWKESSGIPPVERFAGGVPVIEPAKDEPLPFGEVDGLLGQAWFADRVWTFDYLQLRLVLGTPETITRPASSSLVKLGFRQDEKGLRTNHFPRIEITVDGAKLDMLFDTGATTTLTAATFAALGGLAPDRATSFITNKVFTDWHTLHPDWRVLEAADAGTGEAMIQVPEVEIAGYVVGPVWFTRRRDGNFHQYMSQWMDKRVDGAVGGNILSYFRVTVDYPKAEATFMPGPRVHSR